VLKEQAKEKPDEVKIKRLWDAMGKFIREDLDSQDNFLISTYLDNIDLEDPAFVAAYRQMKAKMMRGEKLAPYEESIRAKANQQSMDPSRRRHIAAAKEIALAPLYPGDFVYWISSFEHGPMAGHVATIIEEKDWNKDAKKTNDPLSKIRVDSGNAGGAVAHE